MCLCARKHTSNAAPKAAHSGVIELMLYNTIYNSIIKIWEIICVLCTCVRASTKPRTVGWLDRWWAEEIGQGGVTWGFWSATRSSSTSSSSSSLLCYWRHHHYELIMWKSRNIWQHIQISIINVEACVSDVLSSLSQLVCLLSGAPEACSKMLREPPNVPTQSVLRPNHQLKAIAQWWWWWWWWQERKRVTGQSWEIGRWPI